MTDSVNKGGLAAARPDGEVFCSAPPITGSVNFAIRELYQRLIQSRQFTVGGYMRGRISHKTIRVLAYPVQDAQGKLQAIVTASLDLDWLNDMVKGMDLPPGSTLVMLDRDGTVLARHPDPEQWVGRPAQDGPLARAVKTAAPATPVLLLTGWGASLTANGETLPHVDQILSKPPKLRELRAALVGVTETRREGRE